MVGTRIQARIRRRRASANLTIQVNTPAFDDLKEPEVLKTMSFCI